MKFTTDEYIAAADRLYTENNNEPKPNMSNFNEIDYKQIVTLIGAEIEQTIPGSCEISTLDAVKLLVRENTALRKAVGLPTYFELTAIEEKERHG